MVLNASQTPSKRPRVLVTGAGGPAAMSFVKAIDLDRYDVYLADADQLAPGCYFVDRSRRIELPKGADASFLDAALAACKTYGIDILVPTVDAELAAISANVDRFQELSGTRVLIADAETILTCVDKWTLWKTLKHTELLPQTLLYDSDLLSESIVSPQSKASAGEETALLQIDAIPLEFPLIAKPRFGSGSRGIHLLKNATELQSIPCNASYLLQEHLPGLEYSVDTLADANGEVLSAVPRTRLKVDSGVAITACTVADSELIDRATIIAREIGLKYVANIQFKRDVDGVPKLLEVNPRFPGTMSITVASGINMPALALALVLRQKVSVPREFKSIAMVRRFEERILDIGELYDFANDHVDDVAKDTDVDTSPLQSRSNRPTGAWSA